MWDRFPHQMPWSCSRTGREQCGRRFGQSEASSRRSLPSSTTCRWPSSWPRPALACCPSKSCSHACPDPSICFPAARGTAVPARRASGAHWTHPGELLDPTERRLWARWLGLSWRIHGCGGGGRSWCRWRCRSMGSTRSAGAALIRAEASDSARLSMYRSIREYAAEQARSPSVGVRPDTPPTTCNLARAWSAPSTVVLLPAASPPSPSSGENLRAAFERMRGSDPDDGRAPGSVS